MKYVGKVWIPFIQHYWSKIYRVWQKNPYPLQPIPRPNIAARDFQSFQRNTIIYVVEEAKNVWIFLFCNISAIWQGIYYDFLIKGKMVLCSGAVMTDLADRLLGLKLCKELQPWIRRILDIKLVLEFKIPHICVFIWQYNHREVILEMQKN